MNRFLRSDFASARSGERGVTILVVAIAMLFMVIAIAAIAIDVGAMYTARGEAKHAADASALAGAKVLADSGMTSDPTNGVLRGAAITLAAQVATTVATQSSVGGRLLNSGEVTVSFPNFSNILTFGVAPQVSVTVQRTDFPTFFAKAWGRSTVAVGATSTAEAVNPSNSASVSGNQIVIAPSCVKPWLIPNLDPNNKPKTFFDLASGQIQSSGQVGMTLNLTPFCAAILGCTSATPPPGDPSAGVVQYIPASLAAPPANQEPTCTPATCTNAYEENIAACSPEAITCGVAQNAAMDLSQTCPNYNSSTRIATSCLMHSPGDDTITVAGNPPPFPTPLAEPIQFNAGTANPLVGAGVVSAGSQVSSSDSVVTIPVYDQTQLITSGATPPVNVIGFIQGFITRVRNNGDVTVTIVNMSGCGTGGAQPPVVGNSLSPVPVHLISP